jgi:hypothetical protein
MSKRIAVANTLAAFLAASGMFFFIASTAPSGVQNTTPHGNGGLKSAFSKPAFVETTTIAANDASRNQDQLISSPRYITLPAGLKSEPSLDNNQSTEKNYVFVDQSIDLGEIVIRVR